jgi:hypothetical protein
MRRADREFLRIRRSLEFYMKVSFGDIVAEVAKWMELLSNRFWWQVLLLEVSKLLTVIPDIELLWLQKLRLLRNLQLLRFGNDNTYQFVSWACSSDLTSACSLPAVTWGNSRYCIWGACCFLIRHAVYIIFSTRILLTTMEWKHHSLWLWDSLCKVLYAPGHYIEETSGMFKPTTALSLFLILLYRTSVCSFEELQAELHKRLIWYAKKRKKSAELCRY